MSTLYTAYLKIEASEPSDFEKIITILVAAGVLQIISGDISKRDAEIHTFLADESETYDTNPVDFDTSTIIIGHGEYTGLVRVLRQIANVSPSVSLQGYCYAKETPEIHLHHGSKASLISGIPAVMNLFDEPSEALVAYITDGYAGLDELGVDEEAMDNIDNAFQFAVERALNEKLS